MLFPVQKSCREGRGWMGGGRAGEYADPGKAIYTFNMSAGRMYYIR